MTLPTLMLPPVLKEIALKFPGVQIDIHMERSPS
jgi:hypothetical protein